MRNGERRVTGQVGDVQKYLAHEDGKLYRGMRQDMTEAIRRVRYLDDKVNGASSKDNRAGWKYAGSVPVVVLTDWLSKNGYTWPAFATNEDGCKDKFLRWFMSRENHRLQAHDGKKARGV